jgi:hypothetical protein
MSLKIKAVWQDYVSPESWAVKFTLPVSDIVDVNDLEAVAQEIQQEAYGFDVDIERATRAIKMRESNLDESTAAVYVELIVHGTEQEVREFVESVKSEDWGTYEMAPYSVGVPAAV